MGSLSPSSSPLARKHCLEFGFSGISSSSIDLPVPHKDPRCHGHNDADFDVNAPLPCPVQIDVCPQSRPTPALQTAVVRETQKPYRDCPAAVISPNILDAPHSSRASSSETPVWMHNINATADVNPCNGISAILGQQKACAQIVMIMNGRGLSPPPPFGLLSLYAHTSHHLTWHTVPIMHRSHKLATMSSYSSCSLRLSPNGHLHHSRCT